MTDFQQLTPSYQILIYHPDTRAPAMVPLSLVIERVEQALGIGILDSWFPILTAMAEGIFMQQSTVIAGVEGVFRSIGAREGEILSHSRIKELLDMLTFKKVLERHSVESLYRAGRIDELHHPRVWELNRWWDFLYGDILTLDETDLDSEPLSIKKEDSSLKVSKIGLPVGVSPERDEVRTLLEKKVLSQYEALFRLRLSWYR